MPSSSDLINAIRGKNIIQICVFIIGIVVAIYFYPGIPKIQHPRYTLHILIALFLFGFIWTAYFKHFFSHRVLYCLIILWIFYLAVAYYSSKNPPFPETLTISKLEKLVQEGRYTSIDSIYPEKPFYITSIPGSIKWTLLNIRSLIEQDPPKLRDAYLAGNRLLKLHLFEKEKNDIKLRQVFILIMLGDTKKAWDVFKEVKETKDDDSFCEILNLNAMFDEKNGKFEEARGSLLSAVGKCDSKGNLQLASIYNNLGRMEVMLGNSTNVLHYYQKSAALARKFKNKCLLHTVYPNLIDIYLMNGEKKNALNTLNEYKIFIDKDNIDDLLRFYNYLLSYSRQTKNTGLMISTLKDMRTYVYPKLSHDKQLIFESSKLRIRWNFQYQWDKKLFWVEDHLSEYLRLPFPENYFSLKEAFSILFDLAKTNNLGPFINLFSQLAEFMESIKKDIEQYILRLPNYCVSARCFWETELAFLKKIMKSNEPKISLIDFYEDMFKHLNNIKDINLEHGNPMSAIKSDLHIADECMGAIKAVKEKTVKDYLMGKMTEHLNNACKEIKSFEKHPESNEYFIRVSMYYLFLGDSEKSMEFLNKFDESGISINHYSKWIQDYYFYLNNSRKIKTYRINFSDVRPAMLSNQGTGALP